MKTLYRILSGLFALALLVSVVASAAGGGT